MPARAARLGLLVLAAALAAAAAPAEPAAGIGAAARAFLGTLTSGHRAAAALAFDAPARTDWHYVPRRRAGLAMGEMSPPELRAARALLAASLSKEGLAKLDGVVELERVLFAEEGAFRDPGRYFVALFGTPPEPGAAGAWGWRIEGHHASLHWTVIDGRLVSTAPQFLGANPARVRSGPRAGLRVLGREEDLARELVRSLSAGQRQAAILADRAPADIVTGADRRAAIRDRSGLAFEALSEPQRARLLELLDEYAGVQLEPVADERRARIRAESAALRFAWLGGVEPGEGHYYRIQGESFLVEYDNTQDGANHVHSVWRDLRGEWGEDALAAHYRDAPHHRVAALR